MKELLKSLLVQAVNLAQSSGKIIPWQIEESNIQVETTKDPAHGDYASNLAMVLAKPLGLNPRTLAEILIASLPSHQSLSSIQVAGPGFINFKLSEVHLCTTLCKMAHSKNLNVNPPKHKERIVIDLSSPNLAKEMHVGHLRSTLIGDAVANAWGYLGHDAIRQNHVGDWGTQFGMLLAFLEDNQTTEENLSDIEAFYRAAKNRYDQDEVFAQRARQLVVALQAGDENCLKLWAKFNAMSLSHCQEVYETLKVNLTPYDCRGESAYNDALPAVVEQLKSQGLLTEHNHAQCVFLEAFRQTDGHVLPLIVQKSDGGYLYATTDLAAIDYRVHQLHADRILYFVDHRQSLHFQMVFAVAQRAGFSKTKTRLEFMGFGTMNGPDGRPFRTRDGGTVKLIELLSEGISRAQNLVMSKNPNMPQQEVIRIGQAVGIGAIKYADLSKSRQSDYIFDFNQMLAMEGNTAPYMMYTLARIHSLLFKANLSLNASMDITSLPSTAERNLGQQLTLFEDNLLQMADKGQPHSLCLFLYETASLFSTFYEGASILNETNATMKSSRLGLTILTGKVLKAGLEILGIQTLEKM